MSFRSLLVCVFVPLMACLFTYFATSLHFGLIAIGRPVISYPMTLDLGEYEEGERAVKSFFIENRGSADLIVNNIHANCSCSGMERMRNNDYERIESLRLRAGEKIELIMRVSVRGVQPGQSMVSTVDFQTNDPNHSQCQIIATVKCKYGGVICKPTAVAFGVVPEKAKVTRTIDILDGVNPARIIDHVSVSNPERVSVRLLQNIEEFNGSIEQEPHATLIGRIEIEVDTSDSGTVDEYVSIHLVGSTRSPDKLPIIGRVARRVEIYPSTIVLPRASSAGLVNSSECLFRSSSGDQLTVDADSIPMGFSTHISNGNNSAEKIVRITWNAERVGDTSHDQRQIIRFRATVGAVESILDLPILLKR